MLGRKVGSCFARGRLWVNENMHRHKMSRRSFLRRSFGVLIIYGSAVFCSPLASGGERRCYVSGVSMTLRLLCTSFVTFFSPLVCGRSWRADRLHKLFRNLEVLEGWFLRIMCPPPLVVWKTTTSVANRNDTLCLPLTLRSRFILFFCGSQVLNVLLFPSLELLPVEYC